MIIGITGTDGAGKGAVVDYLKKRGFAHYSARALFLKKLGQEGIEPTRANMRLIGNKMRKEHGNDAVIVALLNEAKENEDADIIVESIRELAGAETLKKEDGILFAVDADSIVRYERIRKRKSESDHISFEEFQKQEALELHDVDPHGLQKQAVIDSADYMIMNNGTLEELHAQIDEVLEKISAR